MMNCKCGQRVNLIAVETPREEEDTSFTNPHELKRKGKIMPGKIMRRIANLSSEILKLEIAAETRMHSGTDPKLQTPTSESQKNPKRRDPKM
jgi:hypothetical protein